MPNTHRRVKDSRLSKIRLMFFAGLLMLPLLAACGDPTTTPADNGSKIAFNFPEVSGVKEVTLDQEVKAEFIKAYGLEGVNYQIYVSDEEADKFATGLDKFLMSQGYKFSLPGATGPQRLGSSIISFYTKSNALDVTGYVNSLAADPAQDYPNIKVSAASKQKFVDQMKGKKSIVQLVTGTDLYKKFEAANPTIPPISVSIPRGLGSPLSTPTPGK